MNQSLRRRIAVLAALCVLCPALARQADPDGVTEEQIRTKLAELEQRTDLEEAVAGEAREAYEQALAELQKAAEADQLARQRRQDAEAAPGELTRIREQLSQPPAKPDVPRASNPGVTEAMLEQGFALAQADARQKRERVTELQAEAGKRNERRDAIPLEVAQARERLDEIEQAIAVPPTPGLPGVVAEAPRDKLLTERTAIASLVRSLEAELANYEARRELLPLRRELAERRAVEAEALEAAWQDQLSRKRQAEANLAKGRAGQLLERAAPFPSLRAFAERNQQIQQEGAALIERLGTAEDLTIERTASHTRLRTSFTEIHGRIERADFDITRAVGRKLRREYEALPEIADAGTLRQELRVIQRQLEDSEDQTDLIKEALLTARGVDEVATGLAAEAARELDAPSDETTATVAELARELVAFRRDELQASLVDHDEYRSVLNRLDSKTAELARVARAYEGFLEERILWVRSNDGPQVPSRRDLREGLAWSLDANAWRNAGDRTLAYASSNLVSSVGGALAVLLLFFAARFARRELHRTAELVRRFATDAFSHTLRAAALTAVTAAPIPAFVYWLGWLLSQPFGQPPAALGMGDGLRAAGVALFPLLFASRALKPTGLADAHFRWPTAALRPFRRNLRWFTPVVTFCLVVVVMYDAQASEAASGAIGRIAFTVGMVALALLVQRTMRPNGPTMTEATRRATDGWLRRLRYVWFTLLFGLPILLIVSTWAGYYYTALQLDARLQHTLALVLVLILSNGVMMRWLFIARRRVAIEDARRRREQALAEEEERAKASHSDTPAESSVPPVDEEKLDLPAVSAQTKQLFRSGIVVTLILGFYVIWADVLPALRVLNTVQVWPEITRVDTAATIDDALLDLLPERADAPSERTEQIPDPSTEEGGGAPAMAIPGATQSADTDRAASDEPALTKLTLADLGLAVLIIAATIAVFRNLPGLIEIAVLQRLPLDAASRFALNTVMRYAIAMVGIIAAFNAINVDWSNVQWLAAALTFGLAFGLQEIFANFVSGLIILAERPIRIGDTVTVGDVSGTVTRIRMRATTITDWDRKELVIPNKTFITDQVINWTLSDPTLRVIIPVGIGYGEDVKKAESILLSIAKDHALVLETPAPYVLFKSFGDSTLDFELRVFIPHIDHILSVRHDMHMRIVQAFREAGIEIAFPQRDLHLRASDELSQMLGQIGARRGATSPD